MRESIKSTVMTLLFSFSVVGALVVTDKTAIEMDQVNPLRQIKLEVTELNDGTIRLKDEDGKTYSFQAEDREILDKVEVGDTINVELEKENNESQ